LKYKDKMNESDFDYQWLPVESLSGIGYCFPNRITRHVLDSYSSPAVYRWVVRPRTKQIAGVYFGETEDLARRIGSYLKPGKKQQTNIRRKALFEKEIAQGCRIEIQTLKFRPFRIRCHEFSDDGLSKVSVRRMLENLVLTIEQDAGPKILNMLARVIHKPTKEEMRQVLERLKKMTHEEKRSLCQKLGMQFPDSDAQTR
jgi:hypothetical protein